jgi:serine protease Do
MKKLGFTVLSVLLGGAFAFGGVKTTGYSYADTSLNNGKQGITYSGSRAAASGVDFTEAAAAVTPAVVYIRVTMGGQGNEDGDGSQGVQMASGSGVIISPNGYIATNNHVVENASKIEVTTNDHRNFIAKVIGTDPNTDLALIKVNAEDLPVVKFGNSDAVKVGEWVLAVGNPFNLTSTVTAGIVSAKGRGIGIIGHHEGQECRLAIASRR